MREVRVCLQRRTSTWAPDPRSRDGLRAPCRFVLVRWGPVLVTRGINVAGSRDLCGRRSDGTTRPSRHLPHDPWPPWQSLG
jgi:hypothetical protein